MKLDNEALLDLCRFRDPLGVLSIYVCTTPDRQAGSQPQWTLATRNELRRLRDTVKQEGPRERWVAVHERLDALGPELDRLCDPKSPGRGRALFVGVSTGEVRDVALQLPLPDRVVLSDTGYVRPLVSALDRGRPAGVVFADRSGVRVLEWRFGEAEERANHPFVDESSEMREMKGPAAGNPAMTQSSAPQKDTFEQKVEEHRLKFLKTMAAKLQKEIAQYGWDRVVVAGEGKMAQPFHDAFPNREVDVLREEHDLRHASAHEVAETVGPLLEQARSRQEIELAERARELALSGGTGSVGLADTLAALAEGRVLHLLVDDAREFSGFRSGDGRLFADGSRPDADVAPEPFLAERMIERALETSARVSPLEGAAAEALASHEGVAAILRW